MLKYPQMHRKRDEMHSEWNLDDVRTEPMLFQSDREYAEKHGGKITREFLKYIPDGWDIVLDSRVHMLKPGWYPCIPGWHLDSIPRPDGQPDYENPPKEHTHIFAVIDCETESITEFIKNEYVTLHRPDENKVYQSFSRQIDLQLESGVIQTMKYHSGDIVEFGSTDFHRGIKATGDGWRFFIRASVDHREPSNETRDQVQAYLEEADQGW